MADIVKFPPKTEEPDEPLVWVCGHCDGQTFRLFQDGTTECHGCGFTDDTQRGGWAKDRESDPGFVPPASASSKAVFDSIEFAKRSVLAEAGRDPETIGVIVLGSYGRLQTWLGIDAIEDPDVKGWVRNMTVAAEHMMLNKKRLPTGPAPGFEGETDD